LILRESWCGHLVVGEYNSGVAWSRSKQAELLAIQKNATIMSAIVEGMAARSNVGRRCRVVVSCAAFKAQNGDGCDDDTGEAEIIMGWLRWALAVSVGTYLPTKVPTYYVGRY
jgi:hypothetical protein